MVSTPQTTPSKKKAHQRPFYKSLLILSPCIVIFFFLGIYLGTNLVGHSNEGSGGDGLDNAFRNKDGHVVTEGLPGTKNVLAIRPQETQETQDTITGHNDNINNGEPKAVRRTVESSISHMPAAPTTGKGTDSVTHSTVRRHHMPVPSTTTTDIDSESSTTKGAGNLRGHTDSSSSGSTTGVTTTTAAAAAAAYSNGQGTVAGGPPFPASFHATGLSSMSVPSPLDNDNIVVGAWVHLDSSSSSVGGNDNDMRTVFTNKAAGCDNHPEQYGLSLYVNAWQEHDHKVYVEYGSSHSGCHKVGSPRAVNVNEWFHVAVSHQRDPSNEEQGVTRIYVNGESIAKSAGGTPPHMVQRNNNFFIGRYDGGAFPFEGNISHFSVVHPPNPLVEGELNAMVAALMRPDLIDSVSGIVAHYPLVDAAASKSESKAVSTVGGGAYTGTYQFPVHPGKVAHGLRVPLLDGLEHRNGAVPTKAEKDESDKKGQKRADEIKKAMSWIWSNYHQYAYGHDELKPVSKIGNDPWGFMGVTLVDSLDTLWLMGLKDEFWQARDWVRDHLSYAQAGTVSVFETTIRSLGGLLAAYDLSGDKAFLEKARTLGDKLAPAFSTSSGVAWGMVDFHSGRGSGGWSGSSAILSEFGTLQIEFRNLAAYTSTPKYEDMAMKGIKFARGVSPSNGLFPIKMDINSGRFTDHTITFGALGDSFYEYLLKVWIQGGKQEDWLREMYDRAMDGVMNELLAVSDPDGLVFVADLTGRAQHRKMDHLVCFLPGLLALGAHTDPTGKDSQRARRDLAVAKSLMYTCREMYHRQISGISPEYVEFPPGKGMTIGSTAPFYILRPETAESLFILNQLTEDPIYREWAWEIWQSIDKHCKAPHGYGALRHVRHPERGIDDRMESFFTAETIKYLWLAQTPDKPIDLDKYVFNTEAHPTKILEGHRPVKA